MKYGEIKSNFINHRYIFKYFINPGQVSSMAWSRQAQPHK